MICRLCNQEKERAVAGDDVCEECKKLERSRIVHFKNANANWMEMAKEAGIELWERQPNETDREHQIWMAFRDAYPGSRPTYRDAAVRLNTSVSTVKTVAMRWDFQVRMQAWAKYCDELTLSKRQEEIINMNEKHISMATKLNEKLDKAINGVDPTMLQPREIKELLKLAQELERKARLETPDVYKPRVVDDEDKDIKHSPTKSGDLKEVMDILTKAGVLNSKNIGVKQTTEIVVKE